MKDTVSYTPAFFKAEFGFDVEQYIYYKAMVGDSSDNIKGITGIGPKNATSLINQFGNIDNIYNNLDQLTPRQRQLFIDGKPALDLAMKLVVIKTDLSVEKELNKYLIQPNNNELRSWYERYEFRRLFESIKEEVITDVDVIIVENEDSLPLLDHKYALYLESQDTNYHTSNHIGIGLSDGKLHYFITYELLLKSEKLKSFFQDSNINKICFDYKKIFCVLYKLGILLEGVTFDLLISSYLIDTKNTSQKISDICLDFGYNLSQDESIKYKSSKKDDLDTARNKEDEYRLKLINLTGRKAKAVFDLEQINLTKLEESDLTSLFFDLELPLAKVLGLMELKGIKLDIKTNMELTDIFSQKVEDIKSQIYTLADAEFNLNSPKELSDILFVKLKLPPLSKTKTGFSTNAEVLEELAPTYLIASHILTYRKYSKLLSTYLTSMAQIIGSDGRIHNIFMQALTQTGRLSSTEPNLQNIPSRDEEGKLIKKQFVAQEGYSFISCDYSQIELRVLASIAKVSKLTQSFNNDLDVHQETANILFPDLEPSIARQRAKVINFATVYGQGAYSLAKDLKVSNHEAKEYINSFFEMYPEIKTYSDYEVDFATKEGYVTTLLKRRRYISELKSSISQERQFGIRLAINTPIQGSAADIIKKALVDLQKYITLNKLESKIILQIHDELIVEAKDSEISLLKEVIPSIMTNCIKLDVKLKTSCDVAKTWYELK
jgi:DNA polymerase-1